jgi:hypothetical protein
MRWSPGKRVWYRPSGESMQDKNILEAQFWWAFSCLAVAGHRNEKDFHAETVRRNSQIYPDAVEVDSIVEEACCHLALVLNRARSGEAAAGRELSGWERHLLALSMRPGY